MHLLLEKRHVVLAALVVMLGLAVFVNWYYTGTDTRLSPEGTASQEETQTAAADGAARFTAAEESADDLFARMKLSRSAARGESLEQLQAVVASADADSEEAKNAGAAIDAITEAGKLETDIETLVVAALGGDCVAVVSENAVDVVVSADALTDDAALKIHDVIAGVCGDRFENVRISAAGA